MPMEERAGFAKEIEDFVHRVRIIFCFCSPIR
jgi:hypothetical protein